MIRTSLAEILLASDTVTATQLTQAEASGHRHRHQGAQLFVLGHVVQEAVDLGGVQVLNGPVWQPRRAG